MDLLIGSDVYWEIVTGEVVRGDSGPVAINTKLGWILSGPVELSQITSVSLTTSHVMRINGLTEEIEENLQSFWELESLGINKREDPVQEQFDEKIQLKDGRYQVALP